MRWISSFPSLVFSPKVTATPFLMKALFKHPKIDHQGGYFNDTLTLKMWLPLLRDLFPDDEIEANDFFLTAEKSMVNRYRQPVLQFISLQNVRKHAKALEQIVDETVTTWEKEPSIFNATDFSFIYTTNVISKLLLGHPGPTKAYLDITQAIGCLNHCMMKTSFWRRTLKQKEKEDYKKSLQIVREAIDIALQTADHATFGSLINYLRIDKEMTEIQIKTTLFMMYLGGSESTGSLLAYLLWQLGQHPEYQEEIYQEMQEKQGTLYEVSQDLLSLDRLFAESIRLFTPVYVTSRSPAQDLDCIIKDKEGNPLIRERITKKAGILIAPTLAARDESLFENPDLFNPHRFTTFSKTYSWLPFGDGKHACPGQWLAKAEILTLVTRLVQKFRITSSPNKEPTQVGNLSLRTAEPLYVELKKR